MAQQQGIQVSQFQPLPTLPHFRLPLGALVCFLLLESFSSFIFMCSNRRRFSIHPTPVTHNRMSSTVVVVASPTNQMTVTPARLDFFVVIVVLTMMHVL
jgi:hypothetical protein